MRGLYDFAGDRGLSPVHTAPRLMQTCGWKEKMMVEGKDMPQPEKWDDDPVHQLPKVIEPGKFGLTLWGAGFDGEPVRNSVWFTWEGGREVEWCQDISPDSPGMYQWASAPVRGTAAWPNGRDVDLTYSSTDFGGLEGEEWLSGAAPTSGNPGTDDGMRDPEQWVRLAKKLDAFVSSLLE